MKLLAIIALLLGTTQNVWAAGLSSLPGHVPSKKIARSVDIGRKRSTDKMQLAVSLNLKDPAGLSDFIKRVYDPADPLNHQFLTPEQFADQFAPTQKDFDEVSQYLAGQGLTIVKSHSNRLVIDVSGSVAEIEGAFQIEMHNYIAEDGRVVFAPTSDPVVSDSIAPRLNGILGLNGFSKRKKFAKKSLSAHVVTLADVSEYLTPAKIKSVYNLNSVSMTGAGETLALFELDGYTASDISEYATSFSISAPALQNVLVDGATGTPSAGADSGADEVTLDIELAMAMAPGLTKIMVYEGPPQTDTTTQQQADAETIDVYSQIATDNLAKTVSSSWGESENEMDSPTLNGEYAIFQQMATQGQSMFAAAGDSGAYDDSVDDLNSTLEVDDPGSQPFVTCAGGTTLALTGGIVGTAYTSESSWVATAASGTFNTGNYSSSEGGGGGISTLWQIPTWQSGLTTTANKGSSTMRMVPDVSLEADPNSGYAVYYAGAYNVYGGTSCSAPLWAAFTSLVNQGRLANGMTRIGFLNPTLYPDAGSSFYATDFHDIADGSTNLFFPAEKGYDLTTGWGSLNGAGLYGALTTSPPLAPSNVTAAVIQ